MELAKERKEERMKVKRRDEEVERERKKGGLKRGGAGIKYGLEEEGGKIDRKKRRVKAVGWVDTQRGGCEEERGRETVKERERRQKVMRKEKYRG